MQRLDAERDWAQFWCGAVAASVSPIVGTAPITQARNRWKKTAWRASSACCVARKYFCSVVGAASM